MWYNKQKKTAYKLSVSDCYGMAPKPKIEVFKNIKAIVTNETKKQLYIVNETKSGTMTVKQMVGAKMENVTVKKNGINIKGDDKDNIIITTEKIELANFAKTILTQVTKTIEQRKQELVRDYGSIPRYNSYVEQRINLANNRIKKINKYYREILDKVKKL